MRILFYRFWMPPGIFLSRLYLFTVSRKACRLVDASLSPHPHQLEVARCHTWGLCQLQPHYGKLLQTLRTSPRVRLHHLAPYGHPEGGLSTAASTLVLSSSAAAAFALKSGGVGACPIGPCISLKGLIVGGWRVPSRFCSDVIIQCHSSLEFNQFHARNFLPVVLHTAHSKQGKGILPHLLGHFDTSVYIDVYM